MDVSEAIVQYMAFGLRASFDLYNPSLMRAAEGLESTL